MLDSVVALRTAWPRWRSHYES